MYGMIKTGDITIVFTQTDVESAMIKIIVEDAVTGDMFEPELLTQQEASNLIAHMMLGDDSLDREQSENLVSTWPVDLRPIPFHKSRAKIMRLPPIRADP